MTDIFTKYRTDQDILQKSTPNYFFTLDQNLKYLARRSEV